MHHRRRSRAIVSAGSGLRLARSRRFVGPCATFQLFDAASVISTISGALVTTYRSGWA